MGNGIIIGVVNDNSMVAMPLYVPVLYKRVLPEFGRTYVYWPNFMLV
jgi:hypothetical protein